VSEKSVMTYRHESRTAVQTQLRSQPLRKAPRTARKPCGASAVTSPVVDAGVLHAFKQREPDAVRALFRTYGNLVYAVAYRTLGQHGLAEEAAQQTFVRAWQAADRLDTARDVSSWLAAIAKNTAIDIYRREARRPARPLVDVAETDPALVTPPPDLETLDAVWRVREAIEALPVEEATVVRMQHLDGMTQTEIAEKLGVALGTVKSRSFRAHRALARLLGHLRSDSDD
jgi:RNA polymerase sigma factor (sigma-70 family)